MTSSVFSKQTHYQVLGVKPDSTAVDIKSAFITLSKSHHPDLHPDDPTKHNTFVRLMEAYTVLSKPELRSTYDSKLSAATAKKNAGFNSSMNTDFDMDVETTYRWRDETIWEMRDRDRDKFYEEKPYYGIKGLKRLNNLWIAGGAVMVMVVGACFHFVALKSSTAFTTNQLDKRDLRLGKELKIARKKALDNGNTLQLELLEAKLAAANAD